MCPDENALVAMIEHELDPARIQELELHFGSCQRCCDMVAALAGSRSFAAGTPDPMSPLTALTDEPLLAGTIGTRYDVGKLIGRGGMGAVYLARDKSLDREVALKLHRAGSGDDRLQREALAMAKLAHPNVVAVYEIGSVDDRLYVAMEYIRGTTLRGWLAEPRTWREIIALLTDVGGGLAAAHAAGLIHRDFKPENVLVGSDGRPRVSDFGLVRIGSHDPGSSARLAAIGATPRAAGTALAAGTRPPVEMLETDHPELDATTPSPLALDATTPGAALDATTPALSAGSNELRTIGTALATPRSPGAHAPLGHAATVTGSVVGTPAYMAPEQFAGGAVDARCDQFAFAVVCWEALFGRRPFAGATLAAIQLAIVDRKYQPHGRRDVPERVRRVLDRALAVDAKDRYPDMPALLAELRRAAVPRTRRRFAIAAAAVVVVAGAGIPIASAARSYQHERACAVEGDAVRVAFGDAERETLRAGFASSGSPLAAESFERTARVIERHRDTLARESEAACAAPDTPDATLRRACLAERTSELVVMIETLGKPDAELVMRAPGAAWSMYEPTPCREPRSRGPRTALTDLLSRASALVDAGRYDDAVAIATPLADAAKRRGDRTDELAALLVLGRARVVQDVPAEAMPILHRALAIAEALGQDADAATALDYMAGIAGLTQHDYTAAHRYADLARAKLERLGDGNLVARGRLLATEAQILMNEYKHTDGEPVIRQAAIVLEQAYGPDHPELGSALGIASQILRANGKTDEALAISKRTLDIFSRAYGDQHPTTAGAQMTLAQSLIDMKRYDEARRLLASADTVFARAFGEHHPVRAAVAGNLGELETQQEHWQAAAAAYSTAVSVLEHSEGPTSPSTAAAIRDLGDVYARAGRTDDALAEFDRSIAILDGLGDDGAARLRGVLVDLARLQLDRKQPAAAVRAAERALAIAKPDTTTPDELANTRLTLARALWDANGDRTRARALAKQAAENEIMRGDATAWLATR